MRKINLEKILKFLKKKTVIVVGVILFVLSAVITITQGGSILLNFLNQSVRHKEILYSNLRHLATETNIDYFKSMLGNPVYTNSFKTVNEYIFVDELFYVQAVVDKKDKVIAYSVTTRDPKFNPKVPIFNNIILGKSKFIDTNIFNKKPDWIISMLGAHDLFYSEGYYLGNPGGYQSIFFSMSGVSGNDGEYVPPPYYQSHSLKLTFNDLQNGNSEILPEDVSTFRENNTNLINTYSMLGKFVSPDDFKEIRDGNPRFYLFGPDNNQVRLLNNF